MEVAMRRAIAAVGGAIAAVAAVRWLRRPRENINWHDAKPPGQILTVDGVPLHYIERGAGQKTAILIHGFLGHTYSFRHVIPELANDHRVIAVDLKGFGYSGRLKKSDYSITEQARLVTRLMDELGIDRASVVGHSLGGEVAMRLAANYPDRVDKLVLAASVSGDRIPMLPVTPLIKPFVWLFGRLFGRRIFRRQFYDPRKATKEVYDGYRRPLRIKGTGDSAYQTIRDGQREKAVDTSGVKQPVLILWASHERILPRWTLSRLRKRFPRAEVVTIDRAGHLLLEEQPQASNAAIRRLLTGAPGTREPVDAAQPATVD
jgi:pimeloyl-ACP methyl ester carboxylesterase